jgi:hypothetical protein
MIRPPGGNVVGRLEGLVKRGNSIFDTLIVNATDRFDIARSGAADERF